MPNTPRLSPENQFPEPAIAESVQVQPKPDSGLQWNGTIADYLTISLASAADLITPWGRSVAIRDKQLREFWPTESYLAGALVNVSLRNIAFDWEIQGASDAVIEIVTDYLRAAIAGGEFGWVSFMGKV